ncbi:MAG: flavodoxin, partial [Chloroflexota bacterium]
DDLATAWEEAGMEPLSPINIVNMKSPADLLEYDYLILGIPTWDIGELQTDWDDIFADLEELDFSGKKIAIFGVGDQYGYPDNFLDAVGILGNRLRERNGELIGFWPTDGYEFDESVGFEDGKFMGLGIDDVNQSELTEERITAWVAQIIGEFELSTVSV